ncbi:hypothetical protein FV139_13245 [Parahaliea maris]|uniref:Uncharacterized protein n=1 Tax=Parahaliea maris TaxID=2716870 RepID=A0A5C8ZZG5_9GAMM|nr:hypothetical protein [Parahaliea maris]TXS92920.1 hypothetical protein FV139_13245 [Parahaliea maris]
MILQRMAESLRSRNWGNLFTELVIVVVGVFIGLQVDTWNDARSDAKRREQIVDALATYLSDLRSVQENVNAEVELGLASWESAYADGRRPPPFYYRHQGSDTAPDMWSTLKQMQLTDLFDPVTLFDLSYFFSELDGVGQKHVRYITFVENQILPGLDSNEEVFYDQNGELRMEFRANMNRLREHVQDNLRLTRWADCLVYRLGATRTFDQSCLSVDHQLDGMSRRL